jgi:hypothetical protein
LSIAERLATTSAKGEIRQTLRNNLKTQLESAVSAAGVAQLGIVAPSEWYDTQNRRTLFQYMSTRNHEACQAVYQSRPTNIIQPYTGSATEFSELRAMEVTIVTAHILTSWEPIEYYGKTLEEVEDVLALRSDLYNGAVMRCLRENITFGTAIERVDIISDFAEVDPTADIEGLVALATVRARVTQEVIIQTC